MGPGTLYVAQSTLTAKYRTNACTHLGWVKYASYDSTAVPSAFIAGGFVFSGVSELSRGGVVEEVGLMPKTSRIISFSFVCALVEEGCCESVMRNTTEHHRLSW